MIALSTAPDRGTAETIVRQLVTEGVVACGNIVPGVTSIYRWRGEVEAADEVLIVFKTTASGWIRLKERLPQLHPYEVPELLQIDVSDGHEPYLAWLREVVN